MEQQEGRLASKAKKWLHSGGARKLLVIAGLLGVALLALSELLPERAESTADALTAEAFAQQAEERLKEIVSSIAGAGECEVLVTLENGVEYVYATEKRSNSDRQEDTDDSASRLTQRDDSESTVIVVDTGDGRNGLLVTELQPTIRGVVIVCEGGDREEVRQRIIEAVTVAMDLSEKRVCVTKLS